MVYRAPLMDLEELCLRCRDPKARSYIEEAVNCYKSGAFRASIVSAYTAILFDLIDKFRDLSLSGDKEAKVQFEAFERASSSGDIAASMKFEKDILDIAHKKLQLISSNELLDLKRIKEDRNRCAHPTITVDGEIFYPSGALARNHIRVAIESLLEHKPSQGKAAIDGIIQLVESEYFPSQKVDYTETLKQSALGNARNSLVRNFLIICLKKLIASDLKSPKYSNYCNVLEFIADNQHEIYSETLKSKINIIIRGIGDENLSTILRFLVRAKIDTSYLDKDIIAKINTYISKESADKTYIEDALEIKVFADSAKRKIKTLSIDDIEDLWLFHSTEVFNRALKLYGNSKNFDEANRIGKAIHHGFWHFTTDKAIKLVEIAEKNSQILGSHYYKEIIDYLLKVKDVDSEKLTEKLES